MSGALVRTGVDVVSIQDIASSLATFGGRFTGRIYAPDERASVGQVPHRLATRFAAKEATLKALDMGGDGVDWRHIAVQTSATGMPSLRLEAKAAARARALGVIDIAVALSHEGDFAIASVVALATAPEFPGAQRPSQMPITVASLQHQNKPNLLSPMSASSHSALEDIERQVRQVLSQHGRLKDDAFSLPADASLRDAGMTSHASVNVMLALEHTYGEMPEDMLSRSVFQSVASITAAMQRLAAA